MGRDTILFNRSFGNLIGNPATYEKLAAANARVIEDHLRVTAFCPEFMGMERITPDDPNLIPSLNQDTLEYRVELRPGARAMSVTFTGKGGGELIQAKRLAVGLFTLATPKYNVTQERLWAYRQNILEYLRDRAEIALGDVSDLICLQYAELLVRNVQMNHDGKGLVAGDAVQNVTQLTAAAWTEMALVKGENARGAGTDDFVVHNLEREDIIRVLNTRGSNYRLSLRHGLFTENDVRTLGLLSNVEYGDRIPEITDRGWTKNELEGCKMITTLKGDILRRGNAYFIGEKQYGCLFVEVLGTQFWGKREANKLFFQMWKIQGAAFLHSHGVVKLELYSGSSNTAGINTLPSPPGLVNWDLGYEAAIPKPEMELGELVNEAGTDGLYVPKTEVA